MSKDAEFGVISLQTEDERDQKRDTLSVKLLHSKRAQESDERYAESGVMNFERLTSMLKKSGAGGIMQVLYYPGACNAYGYSFLGAHLPMRTSSYGPESAIAQRNVFRTHWSPTVR